MMMKLIRLLVMVMVVATVAAAETVTAQEPGCRARMACQTSDDCRVTFLPTSPTGWEFVFRSTCCFGDPWGSLTCTTVVVETDICRIPG